MFSKFSRLRQSGILAFLFLLSHFGLYAQTPIPGHAGKITNGSGGALLTNPGAVFVSGNYAYVASSGSNTLEIVDVTDPANPVHAASISDGDGGALLNNPVAVFVLGNYAYVASAGSSALEIVDVTDPTTPAHTGALTDGTGGAMLNGPTGVYVLGNFAYVVSGTGNSLEIVDVTAPSTPAHAGSIIDGTGGALLSNPSSVFVTGTLAYVASAGSNAIEIIDVTDSANPQHQGSLTDGTGGALLNAPASLVVSGNYAYVASSGSDALEIADVTDPTTPAHYASLTHGGTVILKSPQSVYLSGSYVYLVSNTGDALEIIDASDAANPKHQASFSNGAGGAVLASPTSVFVSGSSAFVTSSSGNALEVIALFTPLAPVATAVTAISETGFTANWTGVSNSNSFEVDVSTDNFATFVSGYNGATASSSSLVVSGLTGCTNYQVRVRGVNANGTSTYSNVVSATTSVTTPVAVGASAITQNGFMAHWNSVSCATGYYLDVATDGGFSSILGSYNNVSVSGTSQSVTSLSAGTTYYYRVRSTNASGTSSNSNTISTITIPADPTATSATSETQISFIANWNSVAGATGYKLDVATDGGFSSILGSYNNVSVSGTSQSVTSLSAGTTYYYRVRSTNASGTSSNSNTISTITIPADPTATSATSETQISFIANWNSVAGATGYKLDVATDGGFSSILASYNNLSVSGTSQSVISLSAGTTYYYRVRSTNASGTSSNSTIVSTITIPADPVATAPTSITQSSFTSNWNTVTGATGYRLDVATDGGFSSILASYNNLSVSGTSQNVTSLSAGTTYYYRVRSTNASGTSSNSTIVSTITIPADPVATAPTSITQSSFTSNWNSVTGVSGYELDVATDAAFASKLASYNNLSVAGTSQSVTGLVAGTTYYYQVRSKNASGSSPNSNAISTITIPADPTATAASAITQSGFTANWNSVTGATSYRIDVATDAAFASTLSLYNDLTVSGTSQAVIGLASNTTYYYRVRTVNGSGSSGSSNTISLLTVTATPTATAAGSLTQNSFTANWNSVTGATGYYLDVATDAAFASKLTSYNNLSVSGTSLGITGLNAGTTYYYQVRSGNGSGVSPSSNVISAITVPADPTATNASAITQNSFTANWNAVPGASGYNLDVATDAGFTSMISFYTDLAVSSTSRSVTSLSAGTNYFYRVRSRNASGVSSSSNVITLRTNEVSVTEAIPTLTSGGTLESYSMFSIPLALQNNDSTINTLFSSLGDYTPDKWRLLRWNSTGSNWDEYKNGISTIDRGKSYWFNSVSPVAISVTGAAFSKASFALRLNPGWNQIGSPYNFDVSWADVLAKNASVTGVSLVETSLYKYVSSTKSFAQTDNLKAWGGGFVFNGGSAITLKIPITVTHATGRISGAVNTNFTNGGDWLLPLKLSVNEVENNYSGIGMHTEAISAYDKFDGITVPRFVKYLELNSYHPDFFEPYFARDVVSTAKNYNWHFMAESNLENQDAVLSWDPLLLGHSDAQLILFDPANGSVVDMKRNDQYHFKLQGKHPLHFFYAVDKESLKPDITSLASVYPNPATTIVSFPIFIANSSERARIEIYDSKGELITSLGNGNYDSGLHLEQWNCTDDQGSRVPSGMYIYRFIGENNVVQTGKLIVK